MTLLGERNWYLPRRLERMLRPRLPTTDPQLTPEAVMPSLP